MASEPALSRHTISLARTGDVGVALLSDIHLGSPNFDAVRLKEDLDGALANGDRVLINGDFFDLIMPSDRKRYQPSALHERLHGEDDLVGAVVDWGAELLGPYGDIIDLIAPGNHETAALRHHHVCLTKALATALKFKGSRVKVAEYAGWAVFDRGRGPRARFHLFHWHGHGKGSGRLAGLLAELGTKGQFIEGADAVWYGHHHGLAVSRVMRVDGRQPKGRRPCWLIRTPSYLDGINYRGYAAEALLNPFPTGCVRLVLCEDGSSRVEVR